MALQGVRQSHDLAPIDVRHMRRSKNINSSEEPGPLSRPTGREKDVHPPSAPVAVPTRPTLQKLLVFN